jgi:hypothetical protein
VVGVADTGTRAEVTNEEAAYEGYRLQNPYGVIKHHYANPTGTNPAIVLIIEAPSMIHFKECIKVTMPLSPDQAFELALTLLRDVSMAKYGHD